LLVMQVNRLVWRNKFLMTISFTVTKYHQHSRDIFELPNLISLDVERADFSLTALLFGFWFTMVNSSLVPYVFSSFDQNVTQKLCSFANEPLQNRGSQHALSICREAAQRIMSAKPTALTLGIATRCPPFQSQKVDWP